MVGCSGGVQKLDQLRNTSSLVQHGNTHADMGLIFHQMEREIQTRFWPAKEVGRLTFLLSQRNAGVSFLEDIKILLTLLFSPAMTCNGQPDLGAGRGLSSYTWNQKPFYGTDLNYT